MGIDALRLMQALPPCNGNRPVPSGGFRFFGGIVKTTLTWENLGKLLGLLIAAALLGWQITSAIRQELAGTKAELQTDIAGVRSEVRSVREEGIERRMELGELRRRVEALERIMEQNPALRR